MIHASCGVQSILTLVFIQIKAKSISQVFIRALQLFPQAPFTQGMRGELRLNCGLERFCVGKR